MSHFDTPIGRLVHKKTHDRHNSQKLTAVSYACRTEHAQTRTYLDDKSDNLVTCRVMIVLMSRSLMCYFLSDETRRNVTRSSPHVTCLSL